MCKLVFNLCFAGSVKFIDYEYGDFNYQAFDIANHFNEYAGRQYNNISFFIYIIT